MRCLSRLLLVLCACGPLACSEADPQTCDDQTYPNDAEATGALLHVSAACSISDANGDPTRPFGTISAAISAAAPGDSVIVAAGTYEEHLVIDKEGLRIIGSPSPAALGIILHQPDPGAAGIILHDPAPGEAAGIILHHPSPETAGIILHSPSPEAAVLVSGVGDVWLQGLRIESPDVAGVWASGGSVTIVGCSVTGARADGEGRYGFGILGTGKAGIILHNVAVEGAESTGVLLKDSGARTAVYHSELSGNGRGGLRLESASQGAFVAANLVDGNLEAGISALSGTGIILHRNAVLNTTPGGPALSADGIVIAELLSTEGESFGPVEAELGDPAASKADAHLDGGGGNIVTGNGRAGILIAGAARGIILHNEVADSGRAGIWIQQGAGTAEGAESDELRIESNQLSHNRFLGIAVAADSHALIRDNDVSGTFHGNDRDGYPAVFCGDEGITSCTLAVGVGVFKGSARVESNRLYGNGQAAFLGNELVGSATRLVSNVYADPDDPGAAIASDSALLVQNVGSDGVPIESDGDVDIPDNPIAIYEESKSPHGFGTGANAFATQ